jgi:hypothetical protein
MCSSCWHCWYDDDDRFLETLYDDGSIVVGIVSRRRHCCYCVVCPLVQHDVYYRNSYHWERENQTDRWKTKCVWCFVCLVDRHENASVAVAIDELLVQKSLLENGIVSYCRDLLCLMLLTNCCIWLVDDWFEVFCIV